MWPSRTSLPCRFGAPARILFTDKVTPSGDFAGSGARLEIDLVSFTDSFAAFDEQFDFVCRALRRHGVHARDVEDIAQDVLIVVWRRWAVYDPARPLRPWLTGIAARVAQDYLKRHRREVPEGELDPEDPHPVGEEHLESARARGAVMAALATLPERHRTPIVLHELEGLPAQQVARMMAVPISTAYTRIRRARLAFARLLGRSDRRRAPGKVPTPICRYP
jgi:RNA polymerase sigma-70 factor (ECF subfamily)